MLLRAARSSAWPPINRGSFDCATVLRTISAKDPYAFVRLVGISTFKIAEICIPAVANPEFKESRSALMW